VTTLDTPAPPAPQRRPATGSPGAVADVRAAAVLVAVLLVVGAALGPLWAWWSPPGPAAVLYPHGAVLPDESEAWIGADGRFLVIVAAVGLLAALVTWFGRPANRGAITAAALGVGAIGGSLLMDLTGSLSGGGDGDGKYRVQLVDGTVRPYSKQLPLWVHTTGLLLVEAVVAVLVYGLLVAFAARDDLGRPDPVRDRAASQPAPQPAPGPQVPASVHADGYPQDGRGDGYRPRPFQQGELPPGQ